MPAPLLGPRPAVGFTVCCDGRQPAEASLRGGVGFGLEVSRWSMRLRARRNCVTVLTGCSDCMPPPSADEEMTALGPQIARSSLPRPLFGFLSAVMSLSPALG